MFHSATSVVLSLWLVPVCVLCLVLWQSIKTGYLSNIDEDKRHKGSRWWVPNIIFFISLACMVYLAVQSKLLDWTVFDWLVYSFSNWVFSWAIGAIILIIIFVPYGAKQKHLAQSFKFNIDLKELGPNKYVAHIEVDRRSGYSGLSLYVTQLKTDYTGDWVVLEEVYKFPVVKTHELTREEVTGMLKGYFDSTQVFIVEGATAIVEVEKQLPDIIVLK